MGTPSGSSHSGAQAGFWSARTVKRAFGCAAGVPFGGPRLAVPVGQMLGRGMFCHALPPHVAVLGERRVGEDAFSATWS